VGFVVPTLSQSARKDGAPFFVLILWFSPFAFGSGWGILFLADVEKTQSFVTFFHAFYQSGVDCLFRSF
jgi:hypothetical protein